MLRLLLLLLIVDLCGAFNTNIMKEATRYVEEEIRQKGLEHQLYCLGKKGSDYFGRRNYNVAASYPGIFSQINYSSSSKIG